MLTFERTVDYELVRQVMTHPAIYPFITDDYSPLPAAFHPLESEAVWYVLVRHEGIALLGLFAFFPQSVTCWEVHTCLLPIARGELAKRAAREMAAWLFEHVPACVRIVTNVPASNRLALAYAKRAGMAEFGRNPQSYRKHGALQDQILLGLSRS